jgi:hypothetical protein
MSGRYRLSRRKEFIEEYFATKHSQRDWKDRDDIALPTPVQLRDYPVQTSLL